MPHIHTEPGQIDHTVTAYVIRTDGDQPRALLHMHRRLHKLMAVGGHIELDETPWGAVAHELTEESGYELDQLSVMQPKVRIEPADIAKIVVTPQPVVMNTHDYSVDHFHADTCYFLTTHEEPKHTPSDGESLDLRWLTHDEVKALGEDEAYENTRVIYTQIFEKFLKAWEAVPARNYRTDKFIGFGVS